MVLYPAIDILHGKVVRASRRGPDDATLYHPDPITVAEEYAAAGAEWLHLVDLDRAFGIGNQTSLVAMIVKRLAIPVQVGGGLVHAEEVEEMRDLGVQRVLLHAKAAALSQVLHNIADQFSGESLGLAIDVEDGEVWARNWNDAGRWTATELAQRARANGLSAVAFTELKREGALTGADIDAAATLSKDAEAFAAQVLGCTRQLDLDDRDPRLNPNGGAIALGHPLGMSGARLLLTAAYELKETGKQYALCTMCVGVGQGMAMIIARV